MDFEQDWEGDKLIKKYYCFRKLHRMRILASPFCNHKLGPLRRGFSCSNVPPHLDLVNFKLPTYFYFAFFTYYILYVNEAFVLLICKYDFNTLVFEINI